MRVVIEIAHWQLSIDLAPVCEDVEEPVEYQPGLSSTTAFGFASDPVFPDLDWGDDRARTNSPR